MGKPSSGDELQSVRWQHQYTQQPEVQEQEDKRTKGSTASQCCLWWMRRLLLPHWHATARTPRLLQTVIIHVTKVVAYALSAVRLYRMMAVAHIWSVNDCAVLPTTCYSLLCSSPACCLGRASTEHRNGHHSYSVFQPSLNNATLGSHGRSPFRARCLKPKFLEGFPHQDGETDDEYAGAAP